MQAGVMPPTTFGIFVVWYLGLPGSTRSGEKHRKKSSPTSSPLLSSIGSTSSSVVPGIGGGFQNDQHAGMEVLGDLLAGGHDVAHVRVFGLAQRRGHADVDGVELGDHGEIRGGAEFLPSTRGLVPLKEYPGRRIRRD